jgi:hypothetical protein|tara:strand:+ start:4819 stop:5079 length:261 start_codon:yes stop_codon:yes gene_type:complete
MDNDKKIQDSHEAKMLLESDVLKKAFKNYRDELIQNWESSQDNDSKFRENIHRAVSILPEVERHLRIIIDKGKIETQQIINLRKVL